MLFHRQHKSLELRVPKLVFRPAAYIRDPGVSQADQVFAYFLDSLCKIRMDDLFGIILVKIPFRIGHDHHRHFIVTLCKNDRLLHIVKITGDHSAEIMDRQCLKQCIKISVYIIQ